MLIKSFFLFTHRQLKFIFKTEPTTEREHREGRHSAFTVDEKTETDRVWGGARPGLWAISSYEARRSVGGRKPGIPPRPPALPMAQASPGGVGPSGRPSVVCVRSTAWKHFLLNLFPTSAMSCWGWTPRPLSELCLCFGETLQKRWLPSEPSFPTISLEDKMIWLNISILPKLRSSRS